MKSALSPAARRKRLVGTTLKLVGKLSLTVITP
jgi:hypothetical protein